jgi:hypothetical protein
VASGQGGVDAISAATTASSVLLRPRAPSRLAREKKLVQPGSFTGRTRCLPRVPFPTSRALRRNDDAVLVQPEGKITMIGSRDSSD